MTVLLIYRIYKSCGKVAFSRYWPYCQSVKNLNFEIIWRTEVGRPKKQDPGFHIMRLFQRWKEGKNFVLFTHRKRVWKLNSRMISNSYVKFFSLIWKFVTSFFEWPSTRPEIDIIANQASEISTDFKIYILCGFSEGFMNAKTREGPSGGQAFCQPLYFI